MKSCVRWLSGLLLVLAWQVAQGETVTKTVTFDAGDVKGQPYSLDELGALVAQVGEEFKVLMVMDKEARTEAYRQVDLRAEDHILMVNGRKLTSVELLKCTLDSVAVGGEIQLGIRRDKDMLIVRYPKADPNTLPKVNRMVVTDVQHEGGPASGEKSFETAGGPPLHVAVLRGAGVVVRQADSAFEVLYLMPLSAESEAFKELSEGDRVVSLQGKPVTDLDGLEASWNAIATGASVDLVCARDGKKHTYRFAKPDPAKDKGGAVMITK